MPSTTAPARTTALSLALSLLVLLLAPVPATAAEPNVRVDSGLFQLQSFTFTSGYSRAYINFTTSESVSHGYQIGQFRWSNYCNGKLSNGSSWSSSHTLSLTLDKPSHCPEEQWTIRFGLSGGLAPNDTGGENYSIATVYAEAFPGGYTAPKPVAPTRTCADTLSDAELVAVARAGGFTGDSITTAVAVALATSGGRVGHARDLNDGTFELGLWGVKDSTAGVDRESLAFSPIANAQAAHGLFTSTGGWAWSPAFTSGSYRAQQSRAAAAAGAPPVGAVVCSEVEGGLSPGEDRDCSGWNVVKSLECAFVPSPETLDRFGALDDQLGDKFPFSLPGDFVSWLGMLTACRTDSVYACGGIVWDFCLPEVGCYSILNTSLANPGGFQQQLRDNREALEAMVWLTAFAPLAWSLFYNSVPIMRLGAAATREKSGGNSKDGD